MTYGNGSKLTPVPHLLNRLFSNIRKSTTLFYARYPCWEWMRPPSNNGYGRLTVEKKRYYLHRIMYQIFIDAIEPHLEIDHLCRNRNPAHLEAVTHRVNNNRGEGRSAKEARQTHCVRGHLMTDYRTSQGKRRCQICSRAWWQQYYRKRMDTMSESEYKQFRETANRHQQTRRAKRKTSVP